MEMLHLHTIQQLQLELANARERNGTYSNKSRISQTNLKEVSEFGHSNGNQLAASGNGAPYGNPGGLSNGNAENVSSLGSAGNAENVSSLGSAGNADTQTDHVHGVPRAPSSLLGMPSYLPPGQVSALHPFVMHQQGVPHSVPSHVPQAHLGHFHSVPAISTLQHWPNQQILAVSEGSEIPNYNQYPSFQTEQNLLRSDTNYNYEVSINGQAQVIESTDKRYLVGPQTRQSLQQISSQFHAALRLDPLEENSETRDKNIDTLTNHGLGAQGLATEQPSSSNTSSESPIRPVSDNEISVTNASSAILPEAFSTAGQKNTLTGGKTAETILLDERSLLACIVRTIPPGSAGRTRISSTLPNRLGKMLAPLHWHDYKKKYGKLDEFVASHPELFVIEGDYIQLREGAQGIIAATAAVAKVAAAVTSSYSSLLPSVAVTPMAQSHRLKKALSIHSNSGPPRRSDASDNPSHILAMQNPLSNGISFNVGGSASTGKILSKPKDLTETNGPRPGQLSGLLTVGNGANSDRSDFGISQSKGLIHGRSSPNVVGKQQG